MSVRAREYRLLIVGGGPAGLAPLIAAHRTGELPALLDRGVVIIEKSARLGSGDIGGYGIASDSSADTFVSCLSGPAASALVSLQSHPLSMSIAALGQGAVPLADVGRFLDLVGTAILEMVREHPNCDVLLRHEAVSTSRRWDDGWLTVLRDPSGGKLRIRSKYVVLATGAHQPEQRLARELVGGTALAEACGDRLIQSGAALTSTGLERISAILSEKADPRVAIVGGSTSAAAVAHALLHRLPKVKFRDGGVTLLHRRELRIYYPSVQEAVDENYLEFTTDDICPVSKRVFRLAGFRLDSRELIMRARGIGNRPPEPRLRLHRLLPQDPAALAIIDGADIVIAALGYRPRALPVFDRDGQEISLGCSRGPQSALVNGKCQVVGMDGEPIPGLFGIGLGAGFLPSGALGGEPSFKGQANGLWLWQNDVGAMIVSSVLAREPHASLVSAEIVVPPASPPRKVPLTRPSPPRLSMASPRLAAIEASGIYSNFGPVNTRFERNMIDGLFDGQGACVTVANATLGLMVAIRAMVEAQRGERRYALMPSFTFAAAAHAAMWCGLTPLLCDIDPLDWAASAKAEEALLKRYGKRIAVLMPYATFGYDIDLDRYETLSRRYNVPVVVDAAASLGTLSRQGNGFGTGFRGAVVYSMHATKSFSTGEGGLVYSADQALVRTIRTMCNFGFGKPRTATMAGINAKLTEVGALLGEMRLETFQDSVDRRMELVDIYRENCPDLSFQTSSGGRQAHQFASALLPRELAADRALVQERLTSKGVGTATYFSPHLAQQDYFIRLAAFGDLPVCDDVGARMLSLPLFDSMSDADAHHVVGALNEVLDELLARGAASHVEEAERCDADGPDIPSFGALPEMEDSLRVGAMLRSA